MDLQSCQLRKLIHRFLCIFIRYRSHLKGDQDLIQMQQRIAVAEVSDLQILQRLDDLRSQQFDLIVNTGELLECIQKHRRRSAQQ